jgi:hypothetical protein
VRLAKAKRAHLWVDRVPATFVAFDLLRLDGTELMGQMTGAPGRPDRPGPRLHRRPAGGSTRPYDNGADLFAVTGYMGL